jgi:hypothetical protein
MIRGNGRSVSRTVSGSYALRLGDSSYGKRVGSWEYMVRVSQRASAAQSKSD